MTLTFKLSTKAKVHQHVYGLDLQGQGQGLDLQGQGLTLGEG